MFPKPHSLARTRTDGFYFCFVNKWRDFSEAAEFASRLGSEHRSPGSWQMPLLGGEILAISKHPPCPQHTMRIHKPAVVMVVVVVLS